MGSLERCDTLVGNAEFAGHGHHHFLHSAKAFARVHVGEVFAVDVKI